MLEVSKDTAYLRTDIDSVNAVLTLLDARSEVQEAWNILSIKCLSVVLNCDAYSFIE